MMEGNASKAMGREKGKINARKIELRSDRYQTKRVK